MLAQYKAPSKSVFCNYEQVMDLLKTRPIIAIDEGGRDEALIMTPEEFQNKIWEAYAVAKIRIAETRASRPDAVSYSEEEFFRRVGE